MKKVEVNYLVYPSWLRRFPSLEEEEEERMDSNQLLKEMGSNLLVHRDVEMDTEVEREEVEREEVRGEEVSEVVEVKEGVVEMGEEEGVLEVDVDVVSSHFLVFSDEELGTDFSLFSLSV